MPDPAPATQAAPATPAAPAQGGEAGFKVEPGFVGSAVNQTRAQRIAASMQAAIAEVGEVSPEQRAREMAGEQPDHGKKPGNLITNEELAEAAKETDEEPPKPAPKGKGKPKEEPEPPPAAAQSIPGVNELIHERQKLRKNYEQKERALLQQVQQREQAWQGERAKYQSLVEAGEAYQAGDMDGFAAALGKFSGVETVKDWNTLQAEAVSAAANPLHREVRALKAQQRAQREQEQRQREVWQQQQQAQQRAAQEQQWLSSVADDLGADEDAALTELVDIDPQFAHYVYTEQKKSHAQQGEIIPAREGAERALAHIWKNVSAWVAFAQKHADSPLVQKITGVKPAPAKKGTGSPNAESGTADRNGVRPKAAKPPPAVSQNRTAEASAMGRLSRRDAIRTFADRINSAQLHESGSGEAAE